MTAAKSEQVISSPVPKRLSGLCMGNERGSALEGSTVTRLPAEVRESPGIFWTWQEIFIPGREAIRRVCCAVWVVLCALLYVACLTGCGSDELTGPVDGRHATGDLVVEIPGGAKMAFMWIEAGTFMMGSPESEPGRTSDEGPQHQVTLTEGFYLGKYEVTQGQWMSVMGSNPARHVKGANRPVFYFSWDDMQAFIEKLNDAAGSDLYRLPTEAEWEYACRAGTTTRWSFGDDESQLAAYAWYDFSGVQDVGTKKPNPWGLYDMHGSMWEYVGDWWGRYSSQAQVDPTGPATGWQRVRRGGCHILPASATRSAYRHYSTEYLGSDVGFRVLRRAE